MILDEGPGPGLVIGRCGGSPRIRLATSGLNRSVVAGWLERFGASCETDPGEPFRPSSAPLARVSTLVVCHDPRVRGIAEACAQGLGAGVEMAAGPDAVRELASEASGVGSLTLVLLHDLLDDPLLQALHRANRHRVKRGESPLPYGFLTALTPAQLAWMVVKTLLWQALGRPGESFDWLDYDGMEDRSRSWRVEGSALETVGREASGGPEPWTSDHTALATLYSHSVSFDASLGEVALCGHSDPPIPIRDLTTAPRCFFDGHCFRLERSDGRLKSTLRSVHASPLVWFLNGCGVIPLAGSAFGAATSYALGLLAGSAVGVVGPFLTQVTEAWRNRLFGALVLTGASTGEAALALSGLLPDDAGFDSYILLGSPELRLLPPAIGIGSGSPAGNRRHAVSGAGVAAVRLEIPPELGRNVAIVADDGAPAWGTASCQTVSVAGSTNLVISFDPPQELDGWVELADAAQVDAGLRSDAAEIVGRLDVLALYPFSGGAAERIATCRDEAVRLGAVAGAERLLRRRLYGAVLLAGLDERLHELGREVAEGFLEEVGQRDVNLDRESHNGFSPGTVRRTHRLCPACDSVLFSAHDCSLSDPAVVRRKELCANCFAVSMALETSPLTVDPPRLSSVEAGRTLELAVGLTNRTERSLRVWLAAAPRLGGRSSRHGPALLELPPRATRGKIVPFSIAELPPGTLSFRFLVVCRGSAEMYNFKYPGHPDRSPDAPEGPRLARG